MRYKAVLMDLDDTLFDFQAGNRAAVNQLMDELGYFHPDRYRQYEEINLACWRALEEGRMTNAQLQTARFARFFDQYRVPGDPEAAGRRFVALLGFQSILLPGALETARIIAARLPVMAVTNGITAVQRSRLALSSLKDVIAGIVISQEAGVAKPDPEIFNLALRALDVGPRDALMIGDGPNSDIRGANNAGIDACWYNRRGEALPEGVHAEYETGDIRDFAAIALGE